MTKVYIKHKVKDYNNWLQGFQSNECQKITKKNGGKSYQIYHFANDPNNVVLLLNWDNLDNAKRFFNSNELKQLAQKNGVIGSIETNFLEEDTQGKI